MILALFGPPGSGKGTQAKVLEKNLAVKQISTGDLLRVAIKNGTALGKQAKEFMDRGDLVPDHLMIGLISEQISGPEYKSGFMLDGFPRTVAQAEALDQMLKTKSLSMGAVISFRVPTDELVSRLGGRLVCGSCGASFHEKTKQPTVVDICDNCGGALIRRKDDSPEVILTRLNNFKSATQPVESFYSASGRLKEIDATGSEAEVLKRIMTALGRS